MNPPAYTKWDPEKVKKDITRLLDTISSSPVPITSAYVASRITDMHPSLLIAPALALMRELALEEGFVLEEERPAKFGRYLSGWGFGAVDQLLSVYHLVYFFMSNLLLWLSHHLLIASSCKFLIFINWRCDTYCVLLCLSVDCGLAWNRHYFWAVICSYLLVRDNDLPAAGVLAHLIHSMTKAYKRTS